MVGARLVNDDDPDCKKLCAKCIKEMISRLSHNDKKKLFDIVIVWLKDDKVTPSWLIHDSFRINYLIYKEAKDYA